LDVGRAVSGNHGVVDTGGFGEFRRDTFDYNDCRGGERLKMVRSVVSTSAVSMPTAA
jgi:hypothetical protein